MHPARIAQTTRWGAWRTSFRTCEVPRTNAGTLQRARKTPQTMMSDTVIGEMSGLTSLIGASAPPSHAPAAKPQKIPSDCRLRSRFGELEVAGTAAVCISFTGVFNGVDPEARDRRGALPAESRNGDRSQWPGKHCVS